ncbi:hypothetical protein D3C76_1143440 [compost metagenome]
MPVGRPFHGGADDGLGEVQLAGVDIALIQMNLEVHVVGAARVVAGEDAAELRTSLGIGDLHAAQEAVPLIGADARIGALGVAVPDLQRGIAQGLAAVQLQYVELQFQRDARLAVGDVLAQQRIFQVERSGGLYRAEAAGPGRAGLAEPRPVQYYEAAQAELHDLAAGGVHEGTPLLQTGRHLHPTPRCADRSRPMRMLALIFIDCRVYLVRPVSRPDRGRFD